MSHNITTKTKNLLLRREFCIETYNYLKSICHIARFFLLLFSFFTSRIKTDMDCHNCFTVYLRSMSVDNHDIECIMKAAMVV